MTLGVAFLPLLLIASGSVAAAAGGVCSSTAFPNSVYGSCNDLPQLRASLHWSYDSASGNLSIAFVAPPPNREGWVAWAVNPSATGMVGSQALIAFHQTNGKMGVKTYNISAYGPVAEGPIAFESSDLAADFIGGKMQIFAKMKLPEGTAAVNHVWQVGSAVADGVPQKHDFKTENLESKGKLYLSRAPATSPAPAPAPLPAPSPAATPPPVEPAPTPSNVAQNVPEVSSASGLGVLLLVGVLLFN